MNHVGFVGLTLLLVGGATLVITRLTEESLAVYDGWRTAEARVIDSAIVEKIVEINERTTSASQGPNYATHRYPAWDFDITYVYRVDGREFTGKALSNESQARIRDGGATEPGVVLRDLAARYARGTTTTVLFNPAKPNQSVVFLTRPRWVAWTTPLGWGLIGLGVAALGAGFLGGALGVPR